MKKNSIKQLMSDEEEHLDKLHRIVEDAIKSEQLIIHNFSNPPLETLTRGQRVSDKVA